jgi:hypothetical protein
MNPEQKLHLQNMISANNVEDQTELIRKLKHSVILRNEANTFIFLKAKHRDDAEKLHLEAMQECLFLFTYYTDIYNKIRKDELDMKMFFEFINVLQEIEDGVLDQHSGSFKVGNLLKEMYVDSALKKAEKTSLAHPEEAVSQPLVTPFYAISWKEFKQNQKKIL